MEKENLNNLKTGSQLPNFISKLYHILQETENENSIKWIETGTGFEIMNESTLKGTVLSQNYRHSNIASFIRQLNMYGFRKVREGERQFYMHQYFRRGKPELISRITRRPEKKVTILEDSSKNIIKESEEELKIIEELEQDPNIIKSSLFDKYFPSKATHESCSSIKPSQLQISKSESLANLIAKSEAIIFEPYHLNEDNDNLSICEHLEFEDSNQDCI